MSAKITRSSLNTIPTSFASVSVGTPSSPLEDKLAAISGAWFQAIELGFPDLLSFAHKHHGRTIAETDYSALCSAAAAVRTLCKHYNLRIMMLQPFANFEGWPKGSKERNRAFARARGWVDIMEALGTDMLQVGSSDSDGISGDIKQLAGDLAELADLLAEKGFRIAYENWCWATHAPTWQKVWQIVQTANRPNLGLCLDTFQHLGSTYADPTTSSGLSRSPCPSASLASSLSALSSTVPASKIFVLQISDAYQPRPALRDRVIDGMRPKSRWSHDYRPCPFQGGDLSRQVVDVARAVLATGVRGGCYFSVEVFDGGPEGGERREADFDAFCRRAKDSLTRLLDECADDER